MYTSNEFRVFLVIFALMAIFVAANMRGIFSKSDRVDSVKIEEGTPTKGVEVEWVGIDKSFYDSPVQPKDTSKTVNVDPDGMTAKSYIVGNAQTGQVYFESKGNLTLPIASMSKLMTAFVGKRVMTGTTTVEITAENIKVFPDQSRLEAGEKFTFDEILYPLLLNSSNVAAEAIATSYGRTEFLELMSSYAWEIGLPTSYFTDPSGLSPNNKASAKGFFELVKYIYRTDPTFFDITKTVSIETATTTEHNYHNFVNIHPYVKDSRFIGGKTGRTNEAGDTMLTMLNIDGNPIAFIILGSAYEKRKADTDILIRKYIDL